MRIKKDKSYRGMLVEIVIKSTIFENLFTSIDELGKILQENLNTNLKFETKVSDIELKNEGQQFTVGKISFKDENDEIRTSEFTITNSVIISD